MDEEQFTEVNQTWAGGRKCLLYISARSHESVMISQFSTFTRNPVWDAPNCTVGSSSHSLNDITALIAIMQRAAEVMKLWIEDVGKEVQR